MTSTCNATEDMRRGNLADSATEAGDMGMYLYDQARQVQLYKIRVSDDICM